MNINGQSIENIQNTQVQVNSEVQSQQTFKSLTADDIMLATFGETSQSIRANFKRTINVRQYETETVEISTILEVNKSLSGIERMIISAILQFQLEYTAYVQLNMKGYITNSEFCDRQKVLENDINALKFRAETLLNKPIDYLFNMVSNMDVKQE